MYNPKYNPQEIMADLKNHNVDMEKFEMLMLRFGPVESQKVYEFCYECVVANNYKMEVFF
ncbi:hypothetical protein KPA96_13830 [Burkholderia cenocepacia]|uniref:hypothetical protein n=1 Tax=Burkholderia cenocepacia TaxID=95486 RepID=UPI002860DB08|nr:hypothetical protein [Burkholderia cenocepacia]MDR8076737.1 hypothetical protein [Burkholderia cenocepacia]